MGATNYENMALPFYTVGHSTRRVDDFVKLLQIAGVTLVVDIRTVPRSRTNPQYNKDVLPESLAAYQISYRDIRELGGLRGKSKTVPPEVNGFWENQSFHNYADYALTEPFRVGLRQLIALGREQRCAMMCSEAVWWRCHRRIVADYLIARGESVFHLMGDDRVDAAKLTDGAEVRDNGDVIYPARY
jgi:uncharacterized protein (DUF488 family)